MLLLRSAKQSAPGHDNIPYEMIQHLPLVAKGRVLELFNRIWENGIYP